jgi:hypothetical protein
MAIIKDEVCVMTRVWINWKPPCIAGGNLKWFIYFGK